MNDDSPPLASHGRRPVRIAILLPSLAAGGAERAALTLASDLVDRGLDVDLVVLRARGDLLKLVPSKAKLIDLESDSIFGWFFAILRYLRDRRPLGLQVHLWPLTVIATLAARAVPGTRVALIDHSTLSKQAKTWKQRIALRLSTRLIYPLAHARVVVSKGAADDLARVSGLPRSAFDVIYNRVALPNKVDPNEQVEQVWGGCDSRIVTAGMLKPEKNHKLLISAFALLRARRPAKLMIIGAGPLLAELKAHAVAEGVEHDVHFPGFQLDPARLMASANVFALSSDYEGFGMVLVEALSLGLAVVSTDCPHGPREILADGRYGRLVPCNDAAALAAALEDALDDRPDPKDQRRQAELLSGDHLAERHLALLLGREPERTHAAQN